MDITLGGLIEAGRAAERKGSWDEALSRYEAAFQCLTQGGTAGQGAELLRWIGTVHRQRGDLELAAELYEASLAVSEASGLPAHRASALNCLALVEQLTGRLDEAVVLYGRAHELAERAGDERLCAMIEQNLGTLANVRGEVDAALRRYASALRRFREVGDELAAAWALNNMGMAHVDRCDWAAAERYYQEAFQLADRQCDAGTLGSVELNRAELYLKQRDFARARESCDRAFEVFSRLDSLSGRAEAHKFYGVLYRETTKPHLAQTHLGLAVELAGRCQDWLLMAESESEWSLVHLEEGRNRDALQCLNRARGLFADLEAGREVLDIERRLDRLEERFLRVVRTWGESIESKDRYTVGHCGRVADFSCRLAEEVGIRGRDLTWFRMGAFLHDVGKTAVPASILNKAGKLTAEEWRLMQSHTVAGDEIVSELNFPWDIRAIVRNHHEHWDGGGYPDGLKGEAIPLVARVLCVADIYDALTTTRSYRPALPAWEALRIMEQESGRILDPELFERFRNLLIRDGVIAVAEPVVA